LASLSGKRYVIMPGNLLLLLISFAADPEDVPIENVQVKSSGHVLPYVGVACLGAILFGYHLGYVFCYWSSLVPHIFVVITTVKHSSFVISILSDRRNE
jgi:hypothetical protein